MSWGNSLIFFWKLWGDCSEASFLHIHHHSRVWACAQVRTRHCLLCSRHCFARLVVCVDEARDSWASFSCSMCRILSHSSITGAPLCPCLDNACPWQGLVEASLPFGGLLSSGLGQAWGGSSHSCFVFIHPYQCGTCSLVGYQCWIMNSGRARLCVIIWERILQL